MSEKEKYIDSRKNSLEKLFELVHTYKIFFEAPISTRLGLEARNLLKVFFEWYYEIIDILTNKDFEYEMSIRFQKYFCYFQYREIQFDRSILIDTCHPCRRGCDIRSDEIKLSDIERIEKYPYFFIFEYTLL